MELSELSLRLIIAFIVLFIMTKIMGRKEISQITVFNFISAIAIGSLAANLALSDDISILYGVLAIVAWALFTLIVAFINVKFQWIRRITIGEPIIVIKNGKIIEKSLRKTQLDMDSLSALLRDKDIFSLKDVDYAIFETSGKLSVLMKEKNMPITKGDMNIPMQKKRYPIATGVISDGIINYTNLSLLHLDNNWLETQLKIAGVRSLSDVFYAEVQPDGSLYIDSKNDELLN
ncbi:YetF domain-containing protein [Ureibacillus acetophenoni]|uniref:Uncharacterized membrane protein YcaP n=1 Tax=Ureibacillus acetophenoni TaxID=614649 RepID=A0A285UMX4_9BACL|nr:DUF421 domain-containing protein [Ureibacillus acetophenoni]SOC42738.1 uncharacterized membrane protein YcaP [Ureibacillus acetophenoni]